MRNSAGYGKLGGDGLFKRFDRAGFGDMFYSPTAAEWTGIRKSKLPDLDSPLAKVMPLNTLYTPLALGGFAKAREGDGRGYSGAGSASLSMRVRIRGHGP